MLNNIEKIKSKNVKIYQYYEQQTLQKNCAMIAKNLLEKAIILNLMRIWFALDLKSFPQCMEMLMNIITHVQFVVRNGFVKQVITGRVGSDLTLS